MAILKQIYDSFAYYQGWYGMCPEHDSNNCENFALLEGTFPELSKKYPEILRIELVSGNSEAILAYSGQIEDGSLQASQQITELKCGNSYRIVLKKGTSQIEIPEFGFANDDTSDSYRLTDTCMPPTPTPTGFVCCGGKLSVRPNQGSVNNLTCVGNVDGELCWDEMTGIQMPKSYLCSFEDENFDQRGLKITVTSNITNSRFRFTKDTGKCYEVALFHQNGEGINVFQLIN